MSDRASSPELAKRCAKALVAFMFERSDSRLDPATVRSLEAWFHEALAESFSLDKTARHPREVFGSALTDHPLLMKMLSDSVEPRIFGQRPQPVELFSKTGDRVGWREESDLVNRFKDNSAAKNAEDTDEVETASNHIGDRDVRASPLVRRRKRGYAFGVFIKLPWIFSRRPSSLEQFAADEEFNRNAHGVLLDQVTGILDGLEIVHSTGKIGELGCWFSVDDVKNSDNLRNAMKNIRLLGRSISDEISTIEHYHLQRFAGGDNFSKLMIAMDSGPFSEGTAYPIYTTEKIVLQDSLFSNTDFVLTAPMFDYGVRELGILHVTDYVEHEPVLIRNQEIMTYRPSDET